MQKPIAAVADSSFQCQLAEARRGEECTRARLVERYRQYLLLVANEELPSAVRAKVAPSDLVQDSIIAATRAFGEFRGQTEGELLAWLRRILRNGVFDATRRFQTAGIRDVRRERPLDSNGDVPDHRKGPLASVTTSEERQTLQQAMTDLCDDDRLVIQLRNFEGLPFTEIADRMQRSVDATKKLWARAIKRLSRNFHELGGEPGRKPSDGR